MNVPQAKIIAMPPQAPEARFEAEVPALVGRAQAVVVRDQASLTAANDISIALTKTLREIEDTFNPIIDHFNKGHKMSLATKAKYAGPVTEALRIIKNDRIGGYLAEQRRKEQEAREAIWRAEQEKIRLQQEAIRKAQEAERKAAEEKAKAEAETRRMAAEADAKAARARSEEGRRKAQEEADRIRREEAERQAERDCKAKAEQDRILSEAAARESAIVDATPAPIEKTKTDGISIREDWDFEVVEAKLIPREFLMVDEVKLRKYAKAMKADANVSGVRFFPKTVTTQRIK
jgi:hypothetical protein